MAKPKAAPTALTTQDDVFAVPLPAGKSEAWYFDKGKFGRQKGLALRVRGETRTWVYLYSTKTFVTGPDARVRLSIGQAGDTNTLEHARATVASLVQRARNNETTPKAIWEADKAAAEPTIAAPVVTLGDVVERYLTARDPETAKSDKLRMTPRGIVEARRYLREYWKPLHGMALKDITRQHVTNRLDEIAADKGAITADRTRTALSGLYAWSMEGDGDLFNPVLGSRRHGDNEPRERTLSDDELVAIWNAADPATAYGRIVRLLMLTACRRDEIAALRWSEMHALDRPADAEIRLPGIRTKNGQPHTVPLSAPALATLDGILRVVGSGYVFPHGNGGFSNFSKAKAALDEKAGIAEHWTLHDIRRTVRTRMGSLGVQPHVAEAILNHLPPRLVRTYDRNPYAAEKRHALDTWAGYLQAIIAKADGGNVVPMRA